MGEHDLYLDGLVLLAVCKPKGRTIYVETMGLMLRNYDAMDGLHEADLMLLSGRKEIAGRVSKEAMLFSPSIGSHVVTVAVSLSGPGCRDPSVYVRLVSVALNFNKSY